MLVDMLGILFGLFSGTTSDGRRCGGRLIPRPPHELENTHKLRRACQSESPRFNNAVGWASRHDILVRTACIERLDG